MYKVGDEVFVKAKVVEVDDGYVRIRTEGYGERTFTVNFAGLNPKTYTQGIADAWELADKLNNMPLTDIIELFGIDIAREEVFKEISPEEALAKIEAYEKEKEIKVGDIVTIESVKGMAVVTNVGEGSVNVMWDDGIAGNCETYRLKKTGKHIDIESLLRQIGE